MNSTSSKKLRIARLLDGNQKSIIALRQLCFPESSFAQKWSKIDEKSIHLGLSEEGELIACLRIYQLSNEKDFFDCTLFDQELFTEGALISRMCTHPKYSNQKHMTSLLNYTLDQHFSNSSLPLFIVTLADSKVSRLVQHAGFYEWKKQFSKVDGVYPAGSPLIMYRRDAEEEV